MKIILLLAFAGACLARPQYAPAAPAYNNNNNNYHDYTDATPAYNYAYAVNGYDSYGPNFSHEESRDASKTNGEYRVALPDGRTQIVTYYVGDYNTGYIADVRYEGQAAYPAYKPAYSKPAYAPAAPAYSAPAPYSG